MLGLEGIMKAVAEYKLNASQAITELTKGKQVSQELGSIKAKTSSWAEKIKEQEAAGRDTQRAK